MEPTNLYESLFIFHKCHTTLQELGSSLHKIDRSKKEFSRYDLTMTNVIIMESVSFIDEFEQNFLFRCEEELKQKVVLARKLCNPILKKIKKWSDMKDFRNKVIAHPWRDKNRNFVVPDHNIYKVPSNWFEHVVLVNLMLYMYQTISSVFPKEIEEMFLYMEKLIPPTKKTFNYEELTNDHIAMAIEVGEIAQKEGHEYQLKIFGYTFD